tara:strand:+ start:123 stop:905 length:783 start_codon:yes stop_codon:yes gene_type:complete
MSFNLPKTLFVIILIFCISLFSLSNPQKTYVAELSRSYLFLIPAWFFSDIKKYVEASEKRKFLSSQLVETSLENMQLREAYNENKRLRAALGFISENLDKKPIAAFVVSRDPDLIYDNLTINIGSEDGVEIGYCVITSKGLVGHVSAVSKSNSIVTLITRSRISALISESRTQGIVTWLYGHTYSLKFVDAVADVKVGQNVKTSGLGGRFPKGLPLGKITTVSKNKNSPVFQTVLLESAVDVINLEEIFVIPTGSGSLDF